MKHTIYLSIAFLIFSITTASFAQTGEIRGKVVDKQTKDPIPFATVTAELNQNVVAGAQTDIDGKYAIKPLTPGKYNVKASCVGFNEVEVKGVIVGADKFVEVTFEMQKDTVKRVYPAILGVQPLIHK